MAAKKVNEAVNVSAEADAVNTEAGVSIEADTPDMQEAQEKEADKPKDNDPWNDMRTIIIPKDDSKLNYEILSVNGRVFRVQKGKRVNVPLPVYEVYMHSVEMKEAADSYMEEKEVE